MPKVSQQKWYSRNVDHKQRDDHLDVGSLELVVTLFTPINIFFRVGSFFKVRFSTGTN